jgi:hypothetical protein
LDAQVESKAVNSKNENVQNGDFSKIHLEKKMTDEVKGVNMKQLHSR